MCTCVLVRGGEEHGRGSFIDYLHRVGKILLTDSDQIWREREGEAELRYMS